MNVPHPAADLLRQYSVGQMSDESAGELEQHLADCPQCEETLDNLAVSDETLISELRRPAVVDPVLEEPELLAALANIVEHAAGVSEAAGESPVEAEGREIGVYRLLEELGSGGMGTVYKALHTRLEKEVALKILATERLRDPHAVSRFDREMKAVGKLEHPHIVRAFDAGEVDGQHFLVTEYVKGCDLSQLSRKLGPLPIADACELARQAALGLEEAHEHGMVHRDIKPANLFLARQKGRPPMVKVLDLGLALIAGEHAPTDELTGTGQIMGTIDYMAPEQAGDTHNVDIRADIYSLGATLYRLLTGSSIYHNDGQQSVMQKLSALATQPAPPIQSRRSEVPDELAAVLHRMLEKDPAGRYATPADVAAALEPFCAEKNLAALLRQPADVERTIVDAAANSASVHDGSVETADVVVVDPELQPTVLSTADHVGGAETVLRPRAARGGRTGWIMGGLALALFAAVGLSYSGILFKLKTADGTLVIEVENAEAKGLVVEVNNEKRSITVGEGGNTVIVSVPPGEKQQIVIRTADGTVLKTDVGQRVEIVTGEKRRIRAWLEQSNYALSFDGKDDYVEIPTLKYVGSHPITFEAIVHARSVSGTVVADTENGGVALNFLDHPYTPGKEWLHLVACSNDNYRIALSRAAPVIGQSIHIAGVFDGKSIALFLNGELQDKVPFPGKLKPSPLPFMIGANPHPTQKATYFFHGTIDEVRISKTARYSKDYKPIKRLEPDEQTLALYHFDDRDEKVLKDDSGNGYHGKIVGATRVNSNSGVPLVPVRKPSAGSDVDRAVAEWVLGIGGTIKTDIGMFDAFGDLPERPFRLTVINLRRNKAIDDESLTRFQPMLNLVELRIDETKFGDVGLRRLKQLTPNLTRLIVSGPNVTDVGLGHIKELSDLEQLYLDDTKVSDNGLEIIRIMPKLSTLSLVNTRISDAGIAHLKGMSSLTGLSVMGTDVSDEGLMHLKGLRLNMLNAGSTKITDAGLKELPQIAGRYFRLRLAETEVSDAGLQYIKDIKGNVVELELTDTQVTAKGIADLRKALQSCRIVWDGGVIEPSATPQAKPWQPTESQQQFLDSVANLPAAEQVEAVRAKLKEVNPGFDGEVTHKIDGGAVVELSFVSDEVSEIWPVRGLNKLTSLRCTESRYGMGQVSNLAPLAGMHLTSLTCSRNTLTDLSPLTGMPLKFLACNNSQASDLSPLTGMPLTTLQCGATQISDLSPLRGMNIPSLSIAYLHVADLSVLQTMKLKDLVVHVPLFDTEAQKIIDPLKIERVNGQHPSAFLAELETQRNAALDFAKATSVLPPHQQLQHVRAKLQEFCTNGSIRLSSVLKNGVVTEVALTSVGEPRLDVSPLMAFKGLRKLTYNDVHNKVDWPDLSSLKHVPLEELNCRHEIAFANSNVLQQIATLKTINGQTAADYWGDIQEKLKDRSIQPLPGTKPWKPSREQQQFIETVAKLPQDQQDAAVRKKLQEINPGFVGKATHSPPSGISGKFFINCDRVTNIWPVRALKDVTFLGCSGTGEGSGKLADLSPLAGMPLTHFYCYNTKVTDLSPLTGMGLIHLHIRNTPINDLAPLQCMPLETLNIAGTKVRDLSPLIGMPLKEIECHSTEVADLTPLAGLPLRYVNCSQTTVSDLSSLAELPLQVLNCANTNVVELSPLGGLPLRELHLSSTPVTDLTPIAALQLTYLGCEFTHVAEYTLLRNLPLQTLETSIPLFNESTEKLIRSLELKQITTFGIHETDIDKFCKRLESRREAASEFGKKTSKLPPEQQVDVVTTKLTHQGALRPKTIIKDGAVTTVLLGLTPKMYDLSPLMAFTKLKKLTLVGKPYWPDLSGLKHVPIEELNCPDAIAFQNSGVLKTIETLKTINNKPAAEYWKELPGKMKRAAK